MNMKVESREERVERAKGVARAIDLIIRTITEARDEGQKLIEEAKDTMDDEKFEEKLEEATETMFSGMNKVVLAHTLATAAMKHGIDLERMK